ncbi:S1C family serine protease [Clostridium sp. Ade.TY]|uniref:S1C family serine protease n=1 Tax=Clostridium sp. Ade.TY TaxID=1391647 RepID=UPI0004171B2C|nr:S1C family serine protease [Clostridium sp. Ade.TY]
MKNNDKGKINIKSKKIVITRKNIIITGVIILIIVVTGVFSVRLAMKEINQTINKKVEAAIKENSLSEVINKVAPSLVTIGGNSEETVSSKLSKNNSTGIVVDSGGLIITSYEKIKNYKEIFVNIPAKGVKPFKGTLLGYNKSADVALIKIPANGLTPINFSNSSSVKEGENVYAIGNSLSNNYIGLITSGIITSTNHKVKINDEYYPIIQTNAVMNDENFGGILCNSKGELVGLNSKYLTEEFSKDNLYFATAVDVIKKSLNDIIKKEDIIGIRGVEVNLDNEYKKGFYIKDVINKSNAQECGLKPTDIILTVNSTKILSYGDLIKILKENKDKGSAEFKILRNGEIEKINIDL